MAEGGLGYLDTEIGTFTDTHYKSWYLFHRVLSALALPFAKSPRLPSWHTVKVGRKVVTAEEGGNGGRGRGQTATRALNNPSNWVIHEEMTYANGTTSRVSRHSASSSCTSITDTPPSAQRICPFTSSSPCISPFYLSRPLGHVTLPDRSICRNDVERNLFVPDSEAQPPSPSCILTISDPNISFNKLQLLSRLATFT